MNKLKFTSGPWKIERRSTPGQFVRTTHIVSNDESHIAEVGPCLIEANAKLIEAAPEMYETIGKLLEWYESDNRHEKPNEEFAAFYVAKELILKINNP